MAQSLEIGLPVTQTATSSDYSLPTGEVRDSYNLYYTVKPTSGGTVTGLKLYSSVDGTTFSKITDDETYAADEVAAIQFDKIPGRFIRLAWTSGVSEAKLVIT